ncbi:hypothetical protein Amet_2148 [Alkaliphilus metalliredigens QYMF]|uniref:Uncharacterized protein n=1 Tax=Alkaliphilus metalliredigens (strain QYMF) TaxID=293826 RepID=A6TQ39_ALKMQ|nr:hypothetical protein [Alkaliphilus metalliredigens]ABR48307.1 hypothetical protein Amet_2148 [Alkaliphilus metalliredigens QYMF]
MKENKNYTDKQLEHEITTLFNEGLDPLELSTSFKDQLLALPKGQQPPSRMETFLEREIRIPLATIPVLALSFIILLTVSLNSFILPGEISHPKYEILELKNTNGSIYTSDSYR